MIDYQEIIFRLLAAVFVGCVIGLDRNLQNKPTGIKTLGLVALGSSLVTMTAMDFSFAHGGYDVSAVSRAIQGVITGIGFLGAGVIVHENTDGRVRGLTTAASIWVTAALGMVCGVGSWKVAVVATVIVLLLLLIGRPLERFLHKRWLSKTDEERNAIRSHDD